MDVEHSSPESLDKTRRQQTHVACEANKVNLLLTQRSDNLQLVLFARATTTFDNASLNSSLRSQFQTAGRRFIAHYDRDFSVWNRSFANRIAQGKHVRSAT